MSTELKMGRNEWLLLGVLSVLWGGSFFFAKIALASVPPLTLVFARVGIASVALGLLLKALGHTLPTDRRLWRTFFVMGLINNLIPFSLLFWGQTYIGAGLASIFNALVPVFTVIIAHRFARDEVLTRGKLVGLALGLIGVTVMIGIDLRNGIDGWTLTAMLACIGAAVSYGFASIYGRRFAASGIAPLSVAYGQVTASALMMIPVVAIIDQPWALPAPTAQAIGALLALGLLSTALAYIIFFRILERGGATNISLVTFLIPVSAIMLSTLFLGETLRSNHVGGMLTILAGLAALDGRIATLIAARWRRIFGRSDKGECTCRL